MTISAYAILNAQGNNMESITAYYKETECVDTWPQNQYGPLPHSKTSSELQGFSSLHPLFSGMVSVSDLQQGSSCDLILGSIMAFAMND